MADMGEMEMPLPENTLPMMTGTGPFGPIEMGGMFTVVKVRDGLARDDYKDPGWYQHPPGTVAYEWRGVAPVAQRPASDPQQSAQTRATTRVVRVRKPSGHGSIEHVLHKLPTKENHDEGCCSRKLVHRPHLLVPRLESRRCERQEVDEKTGRPDGRNGVRQTGRPQAVTRTIRVDMKDEMEFLPNGLKLKRGDTVKFVVRNSGKVMHEMVIGTLDELRKHAELMKKFPNMEHDEPYMAHVAPGKSETIVWQFNKPGEFHYGCLVPGHFEAGMVGRIIVN